MKKIILGLFLFGFLFVGSQVYAEDIFTPTITVTSPNNGGESMLAGSKIEIRWDTNVSANALVDVYVSDGIHKGTVVRGTNNGELGLIYTLDSSLVPGSNYKAYVSIVSETPISDSSDNPFTIRTVKAKTTEDSSCSTGQKFNYLTGKPCSGVVIKDNGCLPGYLFSTITGKKCDGISTVIAGSATPTAISTPLATSTITTPITRILKVGATGEDVKALQEFLNLLADGSFGPKTQAKVIEWQKSHELTPDGVFGRISREKAGLAQ